MANRGTRKQNPEIVNRRGGCWPTDLVLDRLGQVRIAVQQVQKRPHPIKARALRLVLRLLRWLPFPLARSVGYLLGTTGYWLARESRIVTGVNLALSFPQLTRRQRNRLAKASLRHAGAVFGESADALLAKRQEVAARIARVEGKHLLDDCVAAARPVIVLSAHIGNWEFLWLYLQLHYPASAFYRAPKMRELAGWIEASRQRLGGKVFALDSVGLRGCVKSVLAGNVLLLLPDQVPVGNGGVFAPFFGQPAYTMTLLQRLTRMTTGQLLMASCVRVPDGAFAVTFEPFDGDPTTTDPLQFASQLNHNLEQLIRTCPEQYQWHYKRLKVQPNGRSAYPV